MTAPAIASTSPVPPAAGSGKLSWARLARVGIRQSRGTLTALAVFTAALIAFLLATGWSVHACRLVGFSGPPNYPGIYAGCSGQVRAAFAHGQDPGYILDLLQIIPVVFGMFIGVPLLAREFTAGTYRHTWTQAAGRARWLAARIAVPAICVTAAGGVLGLVTSWFLEPYFSSISGETFWGGPEAVNSLFENTPWISAAFSLTVITMAGWALLGFSVGVLLGAVLRRLVRAMAATAAATFTAVIAGWWTLVYLLLGIAPRVAQGGGAVKIAALANGPGAWGFRNSPSYSPRLQPWAIREWITTASGRQFPAGRTESLLYRLAGRSWQSAARWLNRHHEVLHVAYQPASRYWLLQGTAGAILLAASAACIALTFWLAHGRSAG